MGRRILGLTYVNAHRALLGASSMYCDIFLAKGYEAELVDLSLPGAMDNLNRRLTRDEVAFCYAPQGVGSRLGNKEQTIWKKRRIPFVGIHGDNPCYNIFNHCSDTNYVANLYLYESFADIHRRYIQTDQIVDVLPFQTGSIGPSPIPFAERPVHLLYLKSGESVEECVNNLNTLAPPLREGVWQQLERAYRTPNLVVCDLVQELFIQLKLDRVAQFDLFWGCAHWMDMYLRRKRAADFIDWLKMQDGAVIVGNGWDFIDTSNARATFRPSIDINDCVALYQQSRIICNTTPYGRDIVHERVVAGLLNESIVISDTNAWWDEKFGDIAALKRFNWGMSLDDQLQPVLSMPLSAAAAQAPTGRARAKEIFTEQNVVEKIIDCVARIDPDCVPEPVR